VQEEIGQLSRRNGTDHRIVELTKDGIRDQIRSGLEKYEPTLAVACGGDGTVSLLAEMIRDSGIKLGIVPLGSANGMAFQLGIPRDPVSAVEVVFNGIARDTDALRIDQRHLCLHMADLGMNARVVHRFEKGGIRGFAGYARQYFRELFNRHNFRFELHTDQGTYRSRAVMIVLANASFYGTGARITPEGRPDDGRFEVVVVKAYPFWFMFYMAVSMILRNFRHDKFFRTFRCRSATLSLHTPQELQIDGEPMGKSGKVEAEILPARLNVMVPSS